MKRRSFLNTSIGAAAASLAYPYSNLLADTKAWQDVSTGSDGRSV